MDLHCPRLTMGNSGRSGNIWGHYKMIILVCKLIMININYYEKHFN